MYNSSHYQTLSSLKADGAKCKADNGPEHLGTLHEHYGYKIHAVGIPAQQNWICEILLRGLRHGLSVVLACLADALASTREGRDGHEENLTR